MPQLLIWDHTSKNEYPGVCAYAQKVKYAVLSAHDSILAARVKQTRDANQRRRPSPFEKGDKVYVSTKNMSLPRGLAQKPIPKYIGPYEITQDYGNNLYKPLSDDPQVFLGTVRFDVRPSRPRARMNTRRRSPLMSLAPPQLPLRTPHRAPPASPPSHLIRTPLAPSHSHYLATRSTLCLSLSLQSSPSFILLTLIGLLLFFIMPAASAIALFGNQYLSFLERGAIELLDTSTRIWIYFPNEVVCSCLKVDSTIRKGHFSTKRHLMGRYHKLSTLFNQNNSCLFGLCTISEVDGSVTFTDKPPLPMDKLALKYNPPHQLSQTEEKDLHTSQALMRCLARCITKSDKCNPGKRKHDNSGCNSNGRKGTRKMKHAKKAFLGADSQGDSAAPSSAVKGAQGSEDDSKKKKKKDAGSSQSGETGEDATMQG
ncbi:hypothetical protein PHLGIDRAFT_16794 [Phlebiopsis gigantea 11061_1 CR5-6]|uniref:Uncharacterized protein n=1 Tax=Phlebiopsis gigantea (strain 11061_1 CR5-6) TaxID=745531 RepID=A0A0C3RQG2_PHLG1|nr:hypothetical protein PHLGIDRAFT_16794 [Phlebiopsis gigantea 11061_1 CR5-6]